MRTLLRWTVAAVALVLLSDRLPPAPRGVPGAAVAHVKARRAVSVRAPAAVLVVTPAAPRALPLAGVGSADLAFLSEAARVAGGRRPTIDGLLTLARGGASADVLRAAIETELAGDLVLRLVARRWLSSRLGEPAPEIVVPRPATALVGTFGRR